MQAHTSLARGVARVDKHLVAVGIDSGDGGGGGGGSGGGGGGRVVLGPGSVGHGHEAVVAAVERAPVQTTRAGREERSDGGLRASRVS